MSNRFLTLPAVFVLLALPACSGKQTARTHVQSEQPALALQVVDEWTALEGDLASERAGSAFSTMYGNDAGIATTHEGNLRVAQELLELLNSGRAGEAMAMIQELGLADQAFAGGGDLTALLAQLQGGGRTSARGADSALLQQLIGGPARGGGLVLENYGGLALEGSGSDNLTSSRSTSSIDAAFSSHRAAFDKIGP